MKLTIHITAFLFIKLLFLNQGISYSQEISSNNISDNRLLSLSKHRLLSLSKHEQFEKMLFYTNTNQVYHFSESENYFVILQNSKKCDDCFRDINSFIKSNKDKIHANLVVVTLVDSNTLERKRAFVHTKNLMPDFTTFLFQYSGSTSATLFEFCKTSFTPELIVIEKDDFKHIPYKNLFNFPTSEFTSEVKALIYDLP